MLNVSNPELWFFLALIPICLIVAKNDLKEMKIPNWTVLTMVALFIVLGFLVLPFEVYYWRFIGLAVTLVAGFLLSMAKLMGAGDAKFMAAAALFIAPSDAGTVIIILAVLGPITLLFHRLAGRLYVKKNHPDWESFQRIREFPWGLPLTATLLIYLGMAAF